MVTGCIVPSSVASAPRVGEDMTTESTMNTVVAAPVSSRPLARLISSLPSNDPEPDAVSSAGGNEALHRPCRQGAVSPVAESAPNAMKRRERLLVFVRIMFKCLQEDDNVDASLCAKAKQVVKDCTRKNRDRVPGYESLVDAVQTELRDVVGEIQWARATKYLNHYATSRLRKQAAKSAPLSRAAMKEMTAMSQCHCRQAWCQHGQAAVAG